MSVQFMSINDINIDEINKYFEGYNKGSDANFSLCRSSIDFDDFIDNISNKVNNKKTAIKHPEEITCASCGSDAIIEDYSQGIMVCSDCGQVLENILDSFPEWKQFEDDDKAAGRCCAAVNPLLPQSSLGTTIAGMGKNRLKTLHGWNAMPYKERSLNNEFKKIRKVCDTLNILKCVEDDAKIMYKMGSECKHVDGKNEGKFIITRGINRISISAACLFFACIRNNVTRTSKEIALAYGIKDMEMNRGCKNLLKLLKARKMNLKMGTTKPEHFVKRYCDELKIKNIFAEEAIKISRNIEKLNIASDHTPYSLAAASILLMSELNNIRSITKKKLANEFEISEVTILKTYKEIEPYKHVLINNCATAEIVVKINDDLSKESVPPEVLARMKKFGISPDVSEPKNVILIGKKQKTDYKSDMNMLIESNKNISHINNKLQKTIIDLKLFH
jgi:transcription initiation factor TFIIB